MPVVSVAHWLESVTPALTLDAAAEAVLADDAALVADVEAALAELAALVADVEAFDALPPSGLEGSSRMERLPQGSTLCHPDQVKHRNSVTLTEGGGQPPPST